MTERTRPAHILPVPKWTLILHIVQAFFAVVVLGLDAYGIKYIAYDALIYSLVVALFTLAICGYLLVSQLFLHKIYNMYLVLALHALIILFWMVDLGLVANLAHIWANPRCAWYSSIGYSCSSTYYTYYTYTKRDTTSTGSYRGALIAGSIFAAIEFVTWVASAIVVLMHLNKLRNNATATQAGVAPPQYATNNNNNNNSNNNNNNNNNHQAVPMEKYNQQGVPQQPQGAYQQQQPYTNVQSPQPTYPQPSQAQFQQQPVTYHQNPVNRTNTVSPVSHAGHTSTPSELGTPQPTGVYNPNVSELSTPHNTGGYYDANVSELPTK